MADTHPTINARDLINVLKILPANKSVLLVGPHGIGKSQIARQIAAHFNIPLIDRRLAQMTEGDMIGMPKISDDVTRFLPVDWFKKGCEESVVLLLDELNRATLEIMNGAFQIVLDREMNGNVLHPQTRVFACVNAGAQYTVNEMGPALLDRFVVYHYEPTTEDWVEWARGPGKIDPVIVEYISVNPQELREKNLEAMESMTSYPTPRGWDSVNQCLAYANMAPSSVCGETTPAAFFHIVAGIVGYPSAIGFTKFVKNYARIVSAVDILDNWEVKKSVIMKLGHDEVVVLIDKIGLHSTDNVWTADQLSNLENFARAKFSGEDYLMLFQKISTARNLPNVQSLRGTHIIGEVVKAVETADKL